MALGLNHISEVKFAAGRILVWFSLNNIYSSIMSYHTMKQAMGLILIPLSKSGLGADI
jgi:hypothetical protein